MVLFFLSYTLICTFKIIAPVEKLGDIFITGFPILKELMDVGSIYFFGVLLIRVGVMVLDTVLRRRNFTANHVRTFFPVVESVICLACLPLFTSLLLLSLVSRYYLQFFGS